MHKLAVITVNLNNVAGLKRTLESVFNQRISNFEYLVIDGGSTDGSKELLIEHQEKISYWCSEQDTGIYNAMNKGWKKSQAEYCLFLNSGDFFYDENVIADILKNLTGEDLVYGSLLLKGSGSNSIVSVESNPRFSFLYSGSLPHGSTCIRRKVLEDLDGYDEQLKIVSDWKLFILAICKYNCSTKSVNSLWTVFNQDGISSSIAGKDILKNERRQVLNENFNSFVEDYSEYFKYKDFYNAVMNSGIVKFLRVTGLFQLIKIVRRRFLRFALR